MSKDVCFCLTKPVSKRFVLHSKIVTHKARRIHDKIWFKFYTKDVILLHFASIFTILITKFIEFILYMKHKAW